MAWEALMFGGADACPCWAPARFGSRISMVMANSSTIHRNGPGRSARGKIRKENSFHRGVTPAPAYKRPETQSTAFGIVISIICATSHSTLNRHPEERGAILCGAEPRRMTSRSILRGSLADARSHLRMTQHPQLM